MSKEDKGGKCPEPEEVIGFDEDWELDELDYAMVDEVIADMKAGNDEMATDEEMAEAFARWAMA